MKTKTFSSKTIEEAISLAAEFYNVSPDDIEYEVTEAGSKGILGIGARDCTIEAKPLVTALVESFVATTLDKMGFASEVSAIKKDDCITVDISSEFTGAIIGRRGETLDSLQYLATLYINRFFPRERYIRVTLDIENYREKREQALIHLANSVAAKVIRYKKDIILEPMNPLERRIIHSALQNNDRITSKSIGTEPHRKVVVSLS
ncbi:MAG: protein jag [Eubacteriales bacterium]|nr:protein jag [Eubacteriales bacterium]